ncbi:major facilitator superfamily domain-containing protein [Bisporella sp. PMI_857]|nr:major facilitator superfamily domain-containing protein [Bisporella sp. PMI_857]
MAKGRPAAIWRRKLKTLLKTIIVLQLVSEFHEPADIGWYASAYFLPQMVLMPLYGKCYALWRVKWLFISALAIITVGSILCAIARTSAIFITGRAVAGVGAAGIITGAMRIMALAAPRKYRVFLEAASAVILGACTVSGPIIGGAIANSIGWRWSFWVNIPIATVSIVIIFLFCPKGSASSVVLSLPVWEKVRRLDLVGGSLLISSLVCLTCALQLISSSKGLSNSEKLLVIGAVVLLVAFLVHAKFISSEVSLTPRWLLSIKAVWSCCLGLIFLFATTINFIFFLAIYFQTVDGQSAEESAISLLPYAISVSAGAFITSLIVSKTRYYNPFFIFGGALLATGAGLTCTLDINTPSVTRTIYQSILGSGFGCLMLANVAACQTSLADEHHSIAQGLTFFASLLGSTISLPVSSTIFNRILRMRVESLDIPLIFKRLIILDPATVREFIPTEYQQIALEALVYSIRRTFLFGLTCSIVCAVSFYLVPWIPIMSVSGERQRGSGVPDSPPKLPPLSFIQDPEAERSWRWLSNSARVMSTSRSGTPISFMSSIPEGSMRIVPDPARTPYT